MNENTSANQVRAELVREALALRPHSHTVPWIAANDALNDLVADADEGWRLAELGEKRILEEWEPRVRELEAALKTVRDWIRDGVGSESEAAEAMDACIDSRLRPGSESPTGFDARIEPQPIPGVIINPGTGPVQNATKQNAWENMTVFCNDVGDKAGQSGLLIDVESTGDEDEGRFPFTMTLGYRQCEVDMPGLPTASVRFLGLEEQNIWHYPRLYVDGSSWVWLYAISNAYRALYGEEDDDE